MERPGSPDSRLGTAENLTLFWILKPTKATMEARPQGRAIESPLVTDFVSWKDWNSSMPLRNRLAFVPQRRNLFALALSLSCVTGVPAQDSDSVAETSAQASTASPALVAIAPDLYQFPPETPEDLLKAARTTLRFDRVGDSRAFIRRILDLQLGDNELLRLRKNAGMESILELRRDSRLHPEAEELLKAVNAASNAKTHTAEELSEFVKNLAIPGSVGENAAAELLAAGEAAVPALLAAETDTGTGKVVEKLLRDHASALKEIFLRELPTANSETRVRLLRLIGQSGDQGIAIHLLRFAFEPEGDVAVTNAAKEVITTLRAPEATITTSSAAVDHLLASAEQLIRTSHKRFAELNLSSVPGKGISQESESSFLTLLEKDIQILSLEKEWNAAQSNLAALETGEIEADTSTSYANAVSDAKARVKTASDQLAAVVSEKQSLQKGLRSNIARQADEVALRHLSDALVLDAKNSRARLLTAILQTSTENSSSDGEANSGPALSNPEILDALDLALELECSAAAASLLKQFPKDPSETEFQSRAPRLLTKAMNSPDVLVRTIAARIARASFSGQSSNATIARIFRSAEIGSVQPEMVVVSPDDSQLRVLQAVFQDAGFKANVAETGPDGFQLAVSQLNCDLFVLQAESPVWPMATTLANLRADVRTRHTPVVIIGHPRFEERVRAIGETYEGVWFIPEPAGSESLLSKMSQKNIPSPVLTAAQRAEIKQLAK